MTIGGTTTTTNHLTLTPKPEVCGTCGACPTCGGRKPAQAPWTYPWPYTAPSHPTYAPYYQVWSTGTGNVQQVSDCISYNTTG